MTRISRELRAFVVLALLVSIIGIFPSDRSRADTTETVYQTSFEDSSDTSFISPASSYDTSQMRTGTRSLKYERSDPAQYVVLSKSISFQPGFMYEASAFVKTSGLSSSIRSEGVRVAIQAYAGSTYLGGSFSSGSVAAEWESLSSGRYVVPANTTSLTLLLYIYRGTTGTAWFDDLTLNKTTPKLLRSKLVSPSYRGMLIPGDHDTISATTRMSLTSGNYSDYFLDIQLLNSSNQVVDSTIVNGAETTVWNRPAGTLAAGTYTLRIQAKLDSTGAVADTESWRLTKLAVAPVSYLDKHGRLIREGQPFFPIGFYSTAADDSSLDRITGPFNTILPYNAPTAAQLNDANSRGTKVIYSFKDYFYGTPYCPPEVNSVADEVVEIANRLNSTAGTGLLKNHPAILAWYINDELPWYTYEDQLTNHQNTFVNEDPDHPTYYVDNRSFDGAVYMRTSDIYGPDVYPVYGVAGESLNQPGNFTEAARLNLPNRAMWPVVQNFAWAQFAGHNDTERAPTPAELRSMSWQYITAGGRGLMFYALQNMKYDFDNDGDSQEEFDALYASATAVADEVASLVPVIMSVTATPAITVSASTWLDHTVRKYNGKVYVIGVNNGQTHGNSATFTVPGATSVNVVNENRTLPVNASGTFTDLFNSLAVHVYEVTL